MYAKLKSSGVLSMMHTETREKAGENSVWESPFKIVKFFVLFFKGKKRKRKEVLLLFLFTLDFYIL